MMDDPRGDPPGRASRRRSRHTAMCTCRIVSAVLAGAALVSTSGLASVQAGAEAQEAAPTDAAATPATASTLTLDAIGEQDGLVSAQLHAVTQAISDPSIIVALESEVLRYRQRVSDRWTETDHMFSRGRPSSAMPITRSKQWGVIHGKTRDLFHPTTDVKAGAWCRGDQST